MLVRYSPGQYDEKIPVPVQKKIVAYKREGDSKEKMIFEIAGGKEQEVKLNDCLPLMSGENKIKALIKLSGLFLLLIAFCAGSCNMLLQVCSDGYANSSILAIIQLIMGLTLLAYLIWVLKVNIERYLYGGFSFQKGEIYFQSDNEKTYFMDILNKRRKE